MLVYCDTEVYSNYFLACFKNESGKTIMLDSFEGQKLDIEKLKRILKTCTIVTFNGINYDLPILHKAMRGASCQEIKNLSDYIIKEDGKPRVLESPVCKHIDLFKIIPNVVSLKGCGARINVKTIQDLPFDPDEPISENMREDLKTYCLNDLNITESLFNKLSDALDLRRSLSAEYKIDVMNKSDQLIGETILKYYLLKKGVNVFRRENIKPFKYILPDFIQFKNQVFNTLLETIKPIYFKVGTSGRVLNENALLSAVVFNKNKYQFGIGGLHSKEKTVAIAPLKGEILGEFDVTSMYPSIIIQQRLYPTHLDKTFVKIYKMIYNKRLAAKRVDDTFLSGVYKLILNSAYGKFGSKYSFLYSPELLIQTTLTGQLVLLMLVEKLSKFCKIISANTDGVTVLFKSLDTKEVDNIVFEWELETGLNLEFTKYTNYHARDVNNYIAIKENGKAKRKGLYAEGSLTKNFANLVCVESIINYLATGYNCEDYILKEKDITKFLTIRRVTGGGKWKEDYLGKVVRWYYAKGGEPIIYVKNGNKVPKTDGCKPMMTLTDAIPKDLDYDWYYNECRSICKDIGVIC